MAGGSLAPDVGTRTCKPTGVARNSAAENLRFPVTPPFSGSDTDPRITIMACRLVDVVAQEGIRPMAFGVAAHHGPTLLAEIQLPTLALRRWNQNHKLVSARVEQQPLVERAVRDHLKVALPCERVVAAAPEVLIIHYTGT